MTVTNMMGLPESIVRMCDVEPHNTPGSVSITTLLKGTREIILEKRHWDEMTVDASERIWCIYGQVAHKLFEHEGETSVAEERLRYKVNGVTITGRMDLYDLESGLIDDYKTASVYKVMKSDFSDWRQQGIGYAWLLSRNGFLAKRAKFTAILKDWKKSEAKHNFKYPQKPVFVYEFAISESDIFAFDSFVSAKVDALKACELITDDMLPECTPSERWERETKWAVMKPGAKKASKLCDSEDEANRVSKDIDGSIIEERKGGSIKCADYCPSSAWCSYYKAISKGE